MSADLISIFHKTSCNSGFISHLYQHELKHLYSEPPVPRVVAYRLSPTSYLELPSGDKPGTTLSHSLSTKLNNLLKTIRSSQPHFVLCIKPNPEDNAEFDHQFIVSQFRMLNILEACHVMSDGLPHKMKMTTFYARYRVVGVTCKSLDVVTKCQGLVFQMKREVEDDCMSSANMEWVVGTTHVSFSEGARQMMERKRNWRREMAARRIQRWWSQRSWRSKWMLSCDIDVVLQTISLNGLDEVTILVNTVQDDNH